MSEIITLNTNAIESSSIGLSALDSSVQTSLGKADTAVQLGDLATVATSGSYTDLSDKPTIPAAQIQSDWTQSDTTAKDYIKHKPTNLPQANVNIEKGSGSNSNQVLGCTASGEGSFAFGTGTVASGVNSHAEGVNCTALSNQAHAEGKYTEATSENAHAEGNHTTANGNASHTEGYYTVANNNVEHADGQYNVSNKASTSFGNAGNTIHSVGIGNSNARKNAFEVMQNGDAYLIGVGDYEGNNLKNDSSKPSTTLQDTINSKCAFKVIGNITGNTFTSSNGNKYSDALPHLKNGDGVLITNGVDYYYCVTGNDSIMYFIGNSAGNPIFIVWNSNNQ